MVTRYDDISRGCQAIFGWKYIFFQLLLTIEASLVAQIMQSAYLCVVFNVKHNNHHFGKIQDGGQDGNHCW